MYLKPATTYGSLIPGSEYLRALIRQGTITLVYKSGTRVEVRYQAGPEKGCYSFDGTVFCYSGPARCR